MVLFIDPRRPNQVTNNILETILRLCFRTRAESILCPSHLPLHVSPWPSPPLCRSLHSPSSFPPRSTPFRPSWSYVAQEHLPPRTRHVLWSRSSFPRRVRLSVPPSVPTGIYSSS